MEPNGLSRSYQEHPGRTGKTHESKPVTFLDVNLSNSQFCPSDDLKLYNSIMPSNKNISHITEIDAPVDAVSAALFDLEDWKNWNKWTLLATKAPKATAKVATPGILSACYEGNDKDWQTFDFVFGEIRNVRTGDDDCLLTWKGSVLGGLLFSGHHTIRLEAMENDSKKTRMIHEEKFGGLLPAIGMGLPYKKLNRNYLLINEALKAHVESRQ